MCVPTFPLVNHAEGRSHPLTPSFLAAFASVQQAIHYLCGEARVIHDLWSSRVAVCTVVDTIMCTAQLAAVSFLFPGPSTRYPTSFTLSSAHLSLVLSYCPQPILQILFAPRAIIRCVCQNKTPGLQSIYAYLLMCMCTYCSTVYDIRHHPPGPIFKARLLRNECDSNIKRYVFGTLSTR